MSGRRIDDHSSWVGKGSDGSVFPKGVKTKMESSALGAGQLNKYEDTSEAIKSTQVAAKSKIEANRPKAGYRN